MFDGKRYLLTRRQYIAFQFALAASIALPVHSQVNPSTLALPVPLKRGSRIRAVNVGTWIDPQTSFDLIHDRCAREGWSLVLPTQLHRQWRWFSGSDSQRLFDLRAAWRDPDIDAVLYIGAGWGASRVLESGFVFPRRPLWAIGFSDSCSLLLAQWKAGCLGAVHGQFAVPDDQWQRTVDLLSGRPIAPLQGKCLVGGIAEGPLVVTNLTVATHLIGTPWFPDLRGALLLLEDVGEAPYRIDRMLTQWRAAGLLQGLAGIATGRFSWQGEIEPGDFSLAGILYERLSGLGIPFLSDLPVGHGYPNLALPIGVRARLDANDGFLSLLS